MLSRLPLSFIPSDSHICLTIAPNWFFPKFRHLFIAYFPLKQGLSKQKTIIKLPKARLMVIESLNISKVDSIIYIFNAERWNFYWFVF